MSTVLINLSKLETAAAAATKAADSMESYASLIPSKITTPLGNLTGGSSSNTSAVVSLAQQKASELKKRAAEYDALSSQLTSFVSSAREAESRVVSKISAVTQSYVDDMNWWQKICYTVEKLKNKVINLTSIGKFLGNLSNAYDLIDEWLANKTKDIYDWFKRGDGQYILAAVWSGLAAVSAIALAITSFPVSGIFAAIMAGCAVISAVVASIDFVFTFMDAIKAINNNDTEPGVANYYGSTSSVSDWVKKHTTSKTLQSIASIVDTVGEVASLITSFGSNFTKRAADGTVIGTLDRNTIKKNILSKFGIDYSYQDGTYSFDLFSTKKLFGLSTDSTKWHTEGSEYATWFRRAENVKNATTVIKNITSTIDAGVDIAGAWYSGLDSPSDVKDIANGGVTIIRQRYSTIGTLWDTGNTMINGNSTLNTLVYGGDFSYAEQLKRRAEESLSRVGGVQPAY